MIQVSNLTKSYAGSVVLSGVSLHVTRGDVAVIIGPSGGGKSTFLRCLVGLEAFDGGSVEVSGIRLDAHQNKREQQRRLRLIRSRVGMVFQQFHLFPHLTVLQNVTEAPIHVRGIAKDEAVARAELLLDRVGVLAKANTKPSRLSGGEQQRVAIARALAMDPEVILFDEPTSALDPRMTDEVLAVMNDLAAAGQTMVVVTHAMSFARRAGSSIHVFCDGQVVETGPPGEVLENPRQPITRTFLRLATS